MKLPERGNNRTPARCADPQVLERRLNRRRETHVVSQRLRRWAAKAAAGISMPMMPERIQPEPVEMFEGSLNVAFADLRDFSGVAANQCRFPTGEFFCGVVTPDGKPWCSHHKTIVFGYEPRLSDAERQRRAAHMRKVGHCNSTAVRCSSADEALSA